MKRLKTSYIQIGGINFDYSTTIENNIPGIEVRVIKKGGKKEIIHYEKTFFKPLVFQIRRAIKIICETYLKENEKKS